MSRPNPVPVSNKVAAGGAAGFTTTLVTWVLTNWVFKGHMPPDLANLLPGLVGMIASPAAAFLTREAPLYVEAQLRRSAPVAPPARPQPPKPAPSLGQAVQAEIQRLIDSGVLAKVPGQAGNVPAQAPAQ